jgi:hypothetical protein
MKSGFKLEPKHEVGLRPEQAIPSKLDLRISRDKFNKVTGRRLKLTLLCKDKSQSSPTAEDHE